jgi:hypothetical protein
MKMPNNTSFVMYESFYSTYQSLVASNPETAQRFIEAVCEYGLYGEYDTEDPMVNALMVTVTQGIDRAQNRYTNAKANGTTGGRPAKDKSQEYARIKELQSQGKTQKEIASIIGKSTRTIQRILAAGAQPATSTYQDLEFEF